MKTQEDKISKITNHIRWLLEVSSPKCVKLTYEMALNDILRFIGLLNKPEKSTPGIIDLAESSGRVLNSSELVDKIQYLEEIIHQQIESERRKNINKN